MAVRDEPPLPVLSEDTGFFLKGLAFLSIPA
jgi:hypothetical protein